MQSRISAPRILVPRISVLGIALASLSLAACGGGSGGNGGGTINPPPPQSNASLTNLTVSETFPSTSGSISGRLTSSTTAQNVTSAQGAIGNAVTVAYDKDDDSYTIAVNQAGISSTTTFAPADLNAGSSTATVHEYDRTVNGEPETFLLFVPGNPSSNLSYVTYGAWQRQNQHAVDGATVIDFDTSFFVFGVRTPSDDMPSTGSATYNTSLDGFWADASGLNSLSGSASLAADFAARQVSGNFDVVGTNVSTHATHDFDTFTGVADISGNSFSGALNGASTNYKGNWDGGFFGPGAAEIGGTFHVNDGDNQAVGVFVGKK